MIKLNNKGFAISTLLYGLILMMFLIVLALMSVLGSTRKNTKNLIDTIDQELKAVDNEHAGFIYDENSGATDFMYTVPASGWYKIEMYGASYTFRGVNNEQGSFVSGIVYLEKDKDLYVHLASPDYYNRSNAYINYEENNVKYKFLEVPRGMDTYISAPLIMGYAGETVDESLYNISSKPIIYNAIVIPNVNAETYSSIKIDKISDNSPADLPVTKEANSGLDQVRYIKDCTTGSSAGSTSAWTEIQAIDTSGVNVAKGKSVTASGGNQPGGKIAAVTDGLITKQDSNHFYSDNNKNDDNAEKCVTVDLGSPQNLNEVAVWHYYNDDRSYKNHKLQVGSNLDNLTTLRSASYTSYNSGSSIIDMGEPETIMGIRYNRFTPNPAIENTLPNGIYYILYSGDAIKNKVLSNENNIVRNKLFNYNIESHVLQQWSITRRDDGTYRIVNMSNNKALERPGSSLIFSNSADNDNQKWNINPKTAGYYTIMVPSNSGPPYAITNDATVSMIGGGYNNARFKFIRVQ